MYTLPTKRRPSMAFISRIVVVKAQCEMNEAKLGLLEIRLKLIYDSLVHRAGICTLGDINPEENTALLNHPKTIKKSA